MDSSTLVGRRDSWRGLDAALERAIRFEAPQFATVIGPAGSGKTLLLETWLRDVAARGHYRTVRVACGRHGRGSSAHVDRRSLVGIWLRERFGFDDSLDRESALSMFRAQLQAVFGDRRVTEIAAFLAPYVGLDIPRGPLAVALTDRPGHDSDELVRAVLARFLEEDARDTPQVVVLENIDAADESSLDLIESLGRELGQAPLLFVCSARPELRVRRPAWGRHGGSFVRIELEPLGRNDMAEIARSLADPAALGTAGLEPLLARAKGNPGQLVQLIHNGLQTDLTQPGLHSHIVPTANENAALRIADLNPAERELLGRGASFGSLFWTGGLVALGRIGTRPIDPTTVFAPDPSIDDVRNMLIELETRGFVMQLPESSLSGETEWSFCHSAERALLGGLVDPEVMRRRRLFAAQWLEGRVGAEDLHERFELLGTLFEGGGDNRRAGECYVMGGTRAHDEGRFEEARTLYLRGVRLLDLDDSVYKMDALHKLGDLTSRMGRSRESLAHFSEMLQIAWRLDLPAKGGAAHCRIGRLHRGLGSYNVALRHLELGRVLFDLADDQAGVAGCLDDLGRVAMLLGDVDEAMQRHRSALAIRESLGDDRGRALTVSWLGLCEMQQGELLAAERCFKAALELSRRADNPQGIAFALMDLASVEREMRRPDRAHVLLQEAKTLVHLLGEPLTEAHLGIQIGECLLLMGQPTAAEPELLVARDLATRFGTKRLMSQAQRGLAEAHLLRGDAIGARDLAEKALVIAEQIEVPSLTGAALRVMASAESAGAPGDAERGGPRELFDRAIEVLGERGSELELGRVLSAYAEFEQNTGRDRAADELRIAAAGIRARAWNDDSVGLFDRV
jgi:tetratricopeptide (TPR) repeat protein